MWRWMLRAAVCIPGSYPTRCHRMLSCSCVWIASRDARDTHATHCSSVPLDLSLWTNDSVGCGVHVQRMH